MRALRLLCGLIAIAAFSVPAPATAGRKTKTTKVAAGKRTTVRTNQATPLLARKGESARTVTMLRRGTAVVVLERSGRWRYVRAGRHRGWLTRTTLVRTRRPRKERATRADSWRIADDPRTGPVAERRAAATEQQVDDSSDADQPPPPLRDPRVSTTAAVGYRSFTNTFLSDGTADLGNYIIRMAALTATVGARTRLLHSGAISIELDADYRYTYGRPGIHYPGASGNTGDIPFTQHQADAGASLGAWLHIGDHPTQIAARGGYHYGAFLVDDLTNVARMASESLAGPVAGARLRSQPHGANYQLSASVDLLINGARQQTAGLEDGMTSTATAVWAQAGATLPLAPDIALALRYRFERATTRWSGPSSRQTDVTSATRTDSSHLATVGLERGF